MQDPVVRFRTHETKVTTQPVKFCSLAVEDLVANTGQPPFKTVHALAQRTIQDVYYDDSSGSLINAGIWVRRRNGL